MSKKKTIGEYFQMGVHFLRDHPQLWFTGLVALVICAAFVFVSLRFATIAQDAQETLFNTRAGWLLDGAVLFAQDSINDQVALQHGIQSLVEQNPTIDLRILAPYGTENEWRVYVTPTGERQGTVVTFAEDMQTVANAAWGKTTRAYTLYQGAGAERTIVTMRAVATAGKPEALMVLTMHTSEADRLVQNSIQGSMFLLAGILIIVLFLFFRHARIVDFATLYRKQLEIDEMKDSFLSMASHELKSPLSVIRGYIEYLQEDTLEETQRKEFLRRIDVSADELRQLIDDILDVSRIEMGRLRFSPEYVQPITILEEVVEMFTVTAKGKGLTLSLVADEAVRDKTIRVDRGRLKQVLVNLGSNAMKYTLEGSVVVEQKVVGDRLELSVRDSGVGMTAEEQKQLFGKFYRAHAEETKGVKGTGLGLWITKYIIEGMGGTISVESIKGDGSRFVVSFPICEGVQESVGL